MSRQLPRALGALVGAGAVLAGAVPAGDSAPQARIRVPSNFRADVFAGGLSHPTALAWGPDGRLYVAQDGGSVVAIAPGSRGARLFASGFRTPLGLAWRGRELFVSGRGRLESVRLSAGRAVARRTVVAGLPHGLHQQNNVVVGRDGRLYLGSGSTCDACRERDPRSAAILSVWPNGRGLQVVARGLRNPYGLAFQPGTRRLYASVNEQDELDRPGDPEPAETVVVVRRGAWYGWPSCWPSARLKRMVGSCRGVTPPAAYLEPHSSADGIAFYTGRSFPRAYWGDLFVAEWGQYYSHRFGRKLVRVELRPDGRARRTSVFADGFDHPLALAVDGKGGLLVADWGRGVIYRIQARGRP